jgi:hypothetical protein
MATPEYHERLTAPISWWLLGGLFVVALSWVFFVATPPMAAVVAGLVALVLTIWGLGRYGSVAIRVGDDALRVGRATLPWSSVATAESLDSDVTRRVLGVEADARAYLVVRSYCPGSVKVVLDDAVDPTPYWLVSSRKPDLLADHVRRRVVRD